MPHDPHLAERMRSALNGRPGIAEKKMFGGYCWMLHGNMLCGVEVGRFMFRVGKAFEAEALARPGASPMDITGRPMTGFVWVQADEAEDETLHDWIDLCGAVCRSITRQVAVGHRAPAVGRLAVPSGRPQYDHRCRRPSRRVIHA